MKNKLSVLWIFSAVMLIGILLAGCSNPAGGDDDLPTSTIRWQEDSSGFYQFYTNDPENYSKIFWAIGGNPNENAPNIYEVECKKVSGYSGSGYGMVFGASDVNMDLFYSVLINTNGRYTIIKRVSDGTSFEIETIKEWASSPNLNTGYNVLNTIKVEKEFSSYSIYFNDNFVTSFTYNDVNDAANGFGSRGGFSTHVSSAANEKFPNTPVDVRCKAK